jgi:hypothetical protein
MDLLYILGKGSQFHNEELRYSLRSLERFGKNIDRLILVGEKPNFLDYSKVVHLPFKEEGVKDYRIASKILHACTTGTIAGDFLFCNDDFFFQKPFDCNAFPYYRKGQLLYGKAVTAYQCHLEVTRDYLISQNKPTLHFDVHCPIIYNSKKFIKLSDHWEYSKTTIGLVVKSVYANSYLIKGKNYTDVKLKQLIDQRDFDLINLNECFSIYDVAWKNGVESFLMREFQEKSKWEI